MLDPLVATMVNVLDAGLREEFEERAGIMEFDGKLPRAHTERLALLNVLHRQSWLSRTIDKCQYLNAGNAKYGRRGIACVLISR